MLKKIVIFIILLIFILITLDLIVFKVVNTIIGGNENTKMLKDYFSDIGEIINEKTVNMKHKNVVSVSYFTFPNSYKPISFYTEGLSKILEIIERNNLKNNIILRVYYDFTIKKLTEQCVLDLMDKLRKSRVSELVYVDCRKLVPEKNYNSLTMLFRLLPYFNYKDNDVNYNSISDIDFTNIDIKTPHIVYHILTLFKEVMHNKYKLFGLQPPVYKPFWVNLFPNSKYILGCNNYGNIKLDVNIIINYIKDYVNGTDEKIEKFKIAYKELQKAINMKNENMGTDKKIQLLKDSKKTSQVCDENGCFFMYGFDEFFISHYMIPVIKDNAYIRKIYMIGGLFTLLSSLFITTDISELNDFLKEHKIENYENFVKIFGTHDYECVDEYKMNLYKEFRSFCINLHTTKPKAFDKYLYSSIMCLPEYLTSKNNLISMV